MCHGTSCMSQCPSWCGDLVHGTAPLWHSYPIMVQHTNGMAADYGTMIHATALLVMVQCLMVQHLLFISWWLYWPKLAGSYPQRLLPGLQQDAIQSIPHCLSPPAGKQCTMLESCGLALSSSAYTVLFSPLSTTKVTSPSYTTWSCLAGKFSMLQVMGSVYWML